MGLDILNTDVLREIRSSALLGGILEAFLEAVYIAVFVISCYRHCNKARGANALVLATSVMLFCLVTLHWILGVIKLYHTFITEGDTVLGSALYYVDVRDPITLTRATMYVACTVLIDLLLVYRLFIVMQGKMWILAPPLLSMLAFVACFGVQVAFVYKSASISSVRLIASWATAGYTLSLFTSLYPSSIIVYQIILNNMYLEESGLRGSLLPAAYMVMQSVFFCNVFTITALILYTIQSPYVFIVLGINPVCMGINFSLIILQVAMLSESCNIVSAEVRMSEDLVFARPSGCLSFRTSIATSERVPSMLDENRCKTHTR